MHPKRSRRVMGVAPGSIESTLLYSCGMLGDEAGCGCIYRLASPERLEGKIRRRYACRGVERLHVGGWNAQERDSWTQRIKSLISIEALHFCAQY